MQRENRIEEPIGSGRFKWVTEKQLEDMYYGFDQDAANEVGRFEHPRQIEMFTVEEDGRKTIRFSR